jgi:hypothetical protein
LLPKILQGRGVARLELSAEGDHILVDTYNVLFTVSNYLLGKHLFLCNDGMLRDAGEMRGRIVNKAQFSRSVSLMLELLQGGRASRSFNTWMNPCRSAVGLPELSKDMAEMGIKGEAFAVQIARPKADG